MLLCQIDKKYLSRFALYSHRISLFCRKSYNSIFGDKNKVVVIESATDIVLQLNKLRKNKLIALSYDTAIDTIQDFMTHARVVTVVINTTQNAFSNKMINDSVINIQQHIANSTCLSRVRNIFVHKSLDSQSVVEPLKKMCYGDNNTKLYRNFNVFQIDNDYKGNIVAFFIVREINGNEYYLNIVNKLDKQKNNILQYYLGYDKAGLSEMRRALTDIKNNSQNPLYII